MKALHNALYVKSFDDFLENTKPQNIKKSVLWLLPGIKQANAH